jgi:hypothetical protein
VWTEERRGEWKGRSGKERRNVGVMENLMGLIEGEK